MKNIWVLWSQFKPDYSPIPTVFDKWKFIDSVSLLVEMNGLWTDVEFQTNIAVKKVNIFWRIF